MVANRTACVLVCLLVSLLVCLLVCLVACLFACLLACVGVMERTSSHQSSESVRSNLEAELWIPDGEMRNQQRNPPAINPQEEQTNKQTHFYFKACRLKLRASIHVPSGPSAQASTSPPDKITATSRPQSTTTTTTTTTGTHSAS
jgi:hypothetical protein